NTAATATGINSSPRKRPIRTFRRRISFSTVVCTLPELPKLGVAGTVLISISHIHEQRRNQASGNHNESAGTKNDDGPCAQRRAAKPEYDSEPDNGKKREQDRNHPDSPGERAIRLPRLLVDLRQPAFQRLSRLLYQFGRGGEDVHPYTGLEAANTGKKCFLRRIVGFPGVRFFNEGEDLQLAQLASCL